MNTIQFVTHIPYTFVKQPSAAYCLEDRLHPVVWSISHRCARLPLHTISMNHRSCSILC